MLTRRLATTLTGLEMSGPGASPQNWGRWGRGALVTYHRKMARRHPPRRVGPPVRLALDADRAIQVGKWPDWAARVEPAAGRRLVRVRDLARQPHAVAPSPRHHHRHRVAQRPRVGVARPVEQPGGRR